MEPREGLAPAVAEVRLAVRRALAALSAVAPATTAAVAESTTAADVAESTAAKSMTADATAAEPPVVLVALSGGADSLALAAAVAFEAPRAGLRPASVTVDHGLQAGSGAVAREAARQATALGLDARVVTVDVGVFGGPEAAAREARYSALSATAAELGAVAVLLGHTLDDQAETVLLGLARGAGAASLMGMAPVRTDAPTGVAAPRPHGGGAAPLWLRPLLGVRRATARVACEVQGLVPWDDPHNSDGRYARVRVRQQVLPVLEGEIGPGIAEALARTAEQLREDAEAFDELIEETIEDIVEHAEAGISISVAALAANPAALRNRIIRHVVLSEFGESLSRAHTLEVARLVTDWSGQGPIDLPACRARRHGGRIEFTARRPD